MIVFCVMMLLLVVHPAKCSIIVGYHEFSHDPHLVACKQDTIVYRRLKRKRWPHCTTQEFLSGLHSLLAHLEANATIADVQLIVVSANIVPSHLGHQVPFLQTLGPHVVISTGHHRLHALYGFHTSPFKAAVVLVIDGMGQIDFHTLTIWIATAKGLERVSACNHCHVGSWFYHMQMHGNPTIQEVDESAVFHAPDGAYMAKAKNAITEDHKTITEDHKTWSRAVERAGRFLSENPPNSPEKKSALHAALTAVCLDQLIPVVQSHPTVQGLVVSGGVANNTPLMGTFSQKLNLPIWRPSLPGDASLAFGALWSVKPPLARPVVQFTATPLFVPPVLLNWTCENFHNYTLSSWLQRGAVGVWAPGRPIHWRIFSCHPRDIGIPDVLVAATSVHRYFNIMAPVFSPDHAFVLQARKHFTAKHPRVNLAKVAPVELHQDWHVDRLLQAAALACPTPWLLFSTRWTRVAPQFAFRERSLCHKSRHVFT